jgi:S1-C subfamily serine protease
MTALHVRLLGFVALAAVLGAGTTARGQESFAKPADEVNKKMVKLYGSGGFKGLASYGTGMLVSPEGHILTVASHLLDTQDLRVHLYDGRRFHAKVVLNSDGKPAIASELDAALVKIDEEKVGALPFFDIAEAAKRPVAQNGDMVLAFSNQFQIATRDEPMSVQHGVVAAFAKFEARRGVHEAPYQGDVYVLDAITNNPGAGGGALTTRKGELLGVLGKELRNTQSETWVNYAVPVTVLADFVEKAKLGKYVPKDRPAKVAGGGYHGIMLVANPVQERTPPFVEEVVPGSPAAKAGIRSDDLIVYVDGTKVVSIEELQKILTACKPNDELKLEIRRVDKSVEGSGDRLVTVTLKMGQPIVKAPKK